MPAGTKLMLVKTPSDADGVTTVTHYGDTDHPLHLYRQHWGGVRADPLELKATDQQGHVIWTVHDETYYGLLSYGLDIGGFAGYAKWGHDDEEHHAFQSGLRVSPCRLLYGSIAIDGLISSEALGIGASVYPPPAWAGDTWSHCGIGYGRLYGFRGDSANTLYASFSFTY